MDVLCDHYAITQLRVEYSLHSSRRKDQSFPRFTESPDNKG